MVIMGEPPLFFTLLFIQSLGGSKIQKKPKYLLSIFVWYIRIDTIYVMNHKFYFLNQVIKLKKKKSPNLSFVLQSFGGRSVPLPVHLPPYS